MTGDASGLRPGMFVTVRVLYGASQQATLVPASAVWEDPASGEPTVFVVEEAGGLEAPNDASTEIPGLSRRVAVRPVVVLAEGRGQVGLDGVKPGEWVVTLGQHLLHQALQASGTRETTARVRATTWERVLGLQSLQREDLLEGFLDKQQRLARAIGAELPEGPETVDRVLAGEAGSSLEARDGG